MRHLFSVMIRNSIALIILLLLGFNSGFSQTGHTESSIFNMMHPQNMTPRKFTPNPRDQLRLDRQDNVILVSKIAGIAAGSTLGVLNVYWNQNDQLNRKLPTWQSVMYTVPVCLVGSYVGYHTSKWAAKQLMDKEPKMGESFFYGALYGAIDGAAVLSSSLFTAFIIGHYTDTIRFNFENQSWMPVKLLGISLAGGSLYGGFIGGTVGLVAGPIIHLYVQF